MSTEPEKKFSLNDEVDAKFAPMRSLSSFPGEENRASLDEDFDSSIVQNGKPKAPLRGGIKRVRTYKEDIAEAVKNQKASVTSIAAAEERRRTGIPQDVLEKKPRDIKRTLTVLGSILLLLIGIGVIAFFYFFYEKESVVIQQEIPSLVFAESQEEINVTKKTAREILQQLYTSRNTTQLPLGQVSHLYLTESTETPEGTYTQLITTEALLTKIQAQVSGSFLRSLEPSFMLGVHVFNNNQPFIILKSNSYQHAFAGMLEWERTLYDDLFLFTGLKNDPVLGAPIDPQTGNEIVLSEVFEDRIVKNIDVRALTDESGVIKFLYAFPDQKTLIITTNENTLIEIITRLNSVRVF
ncbi:MAG: hypothetical protein WD509_01340 [Candidatus Paceibacterota bacterium]